MLIIWGSRMYGKKHAVRGYGVCDQCGYHCQHESYEGKKWGHLYFIPLIPMGGRVRVLRECSRCKRGQHLPIEKVDEVYRRVEQLLEACVVAAGQGEHMFREPGSGEPHHSGPFLTNAIDTLYVTGRGQDIPGIIELFRKDGAHYEAEVASSAFQSMQGQEQAARQHMEAAAKALPDQPYALVQLAEFAGRAGAAEQQLAFLQQAYELLEGEDVPLLLEMAGPLETLGRFDELVDLLDRAVALAPELAANKKLMKLRKKYGKKADKQRAKV